MKFKLLGPILAILMLIALTSACVTEIEKGVLTTMTGRSRFSPESTMPPLSEGEIPAGWACEHERRWAKVAPNGDTTLPQALWEKRITETWECHWELDNQAE